VSLPDTLKETIRHLPDAPGVYQYLDEKGRLLYVGKAKSLKNRVKSYFSFTPHLAPGPRLGARIARMIGQTHGLEYIVVASESDALILENSLIKQLSPKYNILLRDDKTYPYIYIDLSQDFPRFEITRKVVRGRQIRYFGPFASGGRELLNALYEIFPLVQKKSCAKGKKACLFAQINKCLAPCEGRVTPQDYRKLIDEAIAMINHKRRITKALNEKMMYHAENEQYEEAAKLRDQIQSIEASSIQSGVDLASDAFFDVVAIAQKSGRACAVRLFIREGRVISSSHNFLRFSEGFDLDEAYERAFLAFYGPDAPVTASTVYIAHHFSDEEPVRSWLEQTLGRKVQLIVPQRGEKRQIVDLALKNAEEILGMQKRKEASEEAIAALLGLGSTPTRFEVFDNSHLMGEATVGAMVVYERGEWKRRDFRHYNLTARDEYGQMREMLTRRVEAFEKNPPPDLWVIDGGETLRRLAVDILQSVGVTLPVVAIAKEKLDSKAHRAKGAARDLLHYESELFRLETSDKRLQFFQRLRDEAHRFAITFHRKQKQKKDTQIALLKKKGVGEATLRRLLDVLGSFEAIEAANEAELEAIVGPAMAKKLKAEGLA
jgi:excinuclease ABC subunit C